MRTTNPTPIKKKASKKKNSKKIINNLFNDIDIAIKNKIEKGEKGGYLIFLRKKELKQKITTNNNMLKIEKFIIKINEFINNLIKTKDLVELLIQDIHQIQEDDKKNLEKITNSYKVAENDYTTVVAVDKTTRNKIRTIKKNTKILENGDEKIYQNFLISIVTLYENFIGDMLKLILNTYPTMLPNENKLLYEEFVKFSSLEDIQNFYVESYVRGIIAGKCLEQIKDIDKLLNEKNFLTQYIPIKELVEISSRRNLYVHNKGIINEQYAQNCKEVNLTDFGKIGETLIIDNKYFNNAFNTIYESTLKIAYLTFCKCSQDEDEISLFNKFFNENCYELISDFENKEKVSLGQHLLEFVCSYISNKKHHKAIDRWIYKINLALCYKIFGDKIKCKEILDQEDRSTAGPTYNLALAVLEEKRGEAAKLMGKATEIQKKNKENSEGKFGDEEYHTFPLFFEFRKTPEFLTQYKKIFKKSFIES